MSTLQKKKKKRKEENLNWFNTGTSLVVLVGDDRGNQRMNDLRTTNLAVREEIWFCQMNRSWSKGSFELFPTGSKRRTANHDKTKQTNKSWIFQIT